MSKKSDNYFNNEKRIQTEIKHLLLTEILKMSLSVANSQLYNPNFKTNRIYSYFDLFAGNGEFANGEEGSPLLAFNIFLNHLKNNTKFEELRMLLTDSEKNNIQNLDNLIKLRKQDSNEGRIKYICKAGNWENYSTEIKKQLKESSWGFIFADQFSTELNLSNFINTLKNDCRLKDILIFYNYNTLVRQFGRSCKADITRLCKTLNITEEQFYSFDKGDFSEKFQTSLIESYSSIKEFVIGVSFPTTVNKKLITADYFYLIFATSSVKLLNTFLDAYEKALSSYGNYYPQCGLFDNMNMLNIIKDSNSTNMCDLIIYITREFLSWKNIIENHLFVPTTKYILEKLNDLYKNNEVRITAPKTFFYKNNTSKLKESEACSSRKNMEQVKIEIIKPLQGQLFP